MTLKKANTMSYKAITISIFIHLILLLFLLSHHAPFRKNITLSQEHPSIIHGFTIQTLNYPFKPQKTYKKNTYTDVFSTKSKTAKIHYKKRHIRPSLTPMKAKPQHKIPIKAITKNKHSTRKKTTKRSIIKTNDHINQAVTNKSNDLINQYKSQIIQSISQCWTVPTELKSSLFSRFRIRLAPGGVVIDIKLIRSSGNEALDRSARTAILQASPLPVPSDPALFDQFRVIRLTVSPKGID